MVVASIAGVPAEHSCAARRPAHSQHGRAGPAPPPSCAAMGKMSRWDWQSQFFLQSVNDQSDMCATQSVAATLL